MASQMHFTYNVHSIGIFVRYQSLAPKGNVCKRSVTLIIVEFNYLVCDDVKRECGFDNNIANYETVAVCLTYINIEFTCIRSSSESITFCVAKWKIIQNIYGHTCYVPY